MKKPNRTPEYYMLVLLSNVLLGNQTRIGTENESFKRWLGVITGYYYPYFHGVVNEKLSCAFQLGNTHICIVVKDIAIEVYMNDNLKYSGRPTHYGSCIHSNDRPYKALLRLVTPIK